MEKTNWADWFFKKQQNILQFLEKYYILPQRIPLSLLVKILFQKVTAPNLHQQASSIAFAFSLSLFPTLLFVFSLIPFVSTWVGVPKLSVVVLDLIKEIIPKGIFEFITPTIVDVLDNPRSDMLSLSFIFAVYAASSGVMELVNTFNENYKHAEKRSWLSRRLLSIGLAFLLAFLMILGVLLIMGGELAIHILLAYYWLTDNWVYFWLIVLRYLGGFFVFYTGISLLYYIAPSQENRWSFFSIGSTISSIFAVLGTYIFSYYLSHFATYNQLYGSIGTIIALLLWLYIIAWVLLLGFAINAGLGEAKAEMNYQK
jgi:membrane protein